MTVRSRHISKSLTALLAVSLLAFAGVAGSQAATPTLYVAYTLKCTFAITDDSGKTVTSIPAGAYQVQVTTPGSFGGMDLSGISDMTACKGAADFQLTGPGVNLHTSLNDGDGSQDVLQATFQPNATYVAQDNNQASVTRTSFTTTAATGGTTGELYGRLHLDRRWRRDDHDRDAGDPEGNAHRHGQRGGEGDSDLQAQAGRDARPRPLQVHDRRQEQEGRVHRADEPLDHDGLDRSRGRHEDGHDQPEGRAVVLLHREGHPEVGLHRLRGALRLVVQPERERRRRRRVRHPVLVGDPADRGAGGEELRRVLAPDVVVDGDGHPDDPVGLSGHSLRLHP